MIPFSDEDLQEPVAKVIKEKISPMLAKDGGAIRIVGIRDQRVYVQLQGACVGCSASSSTLKFIVEKELKSWIHPELEVINVHAGEESKYGFS